MKSSGPIAYRKLKSGGYELVKDAYFYTGILGRSHVVLDVHGRVILRLELDGCLWIRAGYQWDGASFIVIDRPANMRAGLFHDGLYQLLRTGQLPQSYRKRSDEIYPELYRHDGGWGWIGALDYAGLRVGAGYAAKRKPEVEAKTLYAGRPDKAA